MLHMLIFNHTYFMPALFLLDVNECTKSSDGCEQNCTNTVGSFECSCDSGFVLDDNHLSCNGKSLYFGLLHFFFLKEN